MSTKWNFGDLELIAKYGALTVALFHALACGDRSVHLAQKKIRALQKADGGPLIETQPLKGNKCCYVLTAAGRKQLGEKGRFKPLGPHSIMRGITTAAYVIKSGIRIMPKEETQKLSEPFFGRAAWPSGIPSTLCFKIKEGDLPVFVTLEIDYGRHIRRLQKFLEMLFRRIEAFPVAKELLEDNLYRFIVLTGHEPRAAKIRRLTLPHAVEVITIPELGDLLRDGH